MSVQTYCFDWKDVVYTEKRVQDSIIESYFEIRNDLKRPIITIPDASLELHFFYRDTDPAVYAAGTAYEGRPLKRPINSSCFGVRFRPGVITDCFREYAEGFDDSNYRIDNNYVMRDVLEQMAGSASFAQRMEIFDRCLPAIEQLSMHPLTRYLIHRIEQSSSEKLNITALVEETGYTHRYVDRLFRAETGVTVKRFADIVRMQQAIYRLKNTDRTALTALACDLGYYDQPHFNRCFKKFTSYSPSVFCESFLQKSG